MTLSSGIRVTRGREGPSHDPYSYVEITVYRLNGDVIVGHFGLAEWVKVNGVKQKPRMISGDFDEYSSAVERCFRRCAGLSKMKAIKIHDNLLYVPKHKRRDVYELMAIDRHMLACAY